MTGPKQIKNKIGATLFALVFAIGFTLGGIAAGVVPAVKLLSDWWQARAYIPIEAKVLSADLKTFHGDGTTYRATGRFSYRYLERDYQTDRVFLGDGSSDNIGNYHHGLDAQLRAARDDARTVTLWVNPDHPEQAVYDRAIRWRKLLFLLPFALLFPAVGMGAWWIIWHIWFGKQEADSMPAEGMQVSPEPGAAVMWIFAAFWNLISWPVAGVLLPGRHSGGLAWLVILFPLIGLGLAAAAVAATRTRWRIGKPVLSLSHAARPGDIPLQAQIHFYPSFASRLNPNQYWHEARVELNYIHEDRRGEDTRKTTLWQQEAVNTRLLRGTESMGLHADLPTGLPNAPVSQSADAYYWQVVLKALGAEVIFKLPPAAVEPDRIGGLAPAGPPPPGLSDAEIRAKYAKTRRLIGWAGATAVLIPAAFMLWEFVPAYLNREEKAQSAEKQKEAVRVARHEAARPETRAELLAQLRQKLASGMSADSADEGGTTLLMQAAQEGNVNGVRLLIEHGANVNATTPVDGDGMGGRTALIAAIQGDVPEVVELLLAAGADAKAASNLFWTPMHYAAYRGATASIRVLHLHGAPVDQPFAGARGSTPLMIAAQHDRVAAIRTLLELGADPKHADLYGENACGYARYFKKEAAGKALSCGG